MTFPWETLEPIVRDLYVTQDLKLDRVIEEVKAKHGYTIKSRTYREKFRTWKSRKSDYKEPKPKRSNRATRSQSRSSSHRVGARTSPRKNSPVSTRTSSTNTRSRGRPTPALRRDRLRPLSSDEQWPIYEDTGSTHRKFEQSVYTSMDSMNRMSGFQDQAELTESNLVPVVTGPPLTNQSLKELTSAHINTRDNPGQPQVFQSAYPESTLPVQFGDRYVTHTPPKPVAPGLLQWPTRPSYNDHNNSTWEAGEFVPCDKMSCSYTRMPDMRAPLIFYPTTAQVPTSGYSSSSPSLTWKSSPQETQSTNSVSDPTAEQNDFRLSPRCPELHYEDSLKMGCNERPANPRSLSCHLQPENTSSSLQSHQWYDMDNPHLSQIGSQIDGFPDESENYDHFLHQMQSQDTGRYPLQQDDQSLWQGWCPDNGQALNTVTTEVESHTPLLQENFEPTMTMFAPYAGSYAFPPRNGFNLQDATMAPAHEGFGMLYQQNNIMEHDGPFFAPLATSLQLPFDLSQHPPQNCESPINTFNTYYSTSVPESVLQHDALGFDPTSEHRQ